MLGTVHNMTNDTSLESSYALLLKSAKNLANLQKLIFFAKSSNKIENFAKKMSKTLIEYTFLKTH